MGEGGWWSGGGKEVVLEDGDVEEEGCDLGEGLEAHEYFEFGEGYGNFGFVV